MSTWEYASIDLGKEADMGNPGHTMWAAYIKWPGAERLDVRDRVNINELLNELGAQGWELATEVPSQMGIEHRVFRLKRQR